MQDNFDIDKKNILLKKDKSKKGSIDKPIIELINYLNSLRDYYTTSSCSGRILILRIPKSGRKDKVEWLLTSHSRIKINEAKAAIEEYKKNFEKGDELWFKQEPLILHVVARTLDKAQELLDIAKYSGFKKSGIIASTRRFVVEIEGTDFLSTIIGKEGRVFIDDNYLGLLIRTANKKLMRNLKKKDVFVKLLKKELKRG